MTYSSMPSVSVALVVALASLAGCAGSDGAGPGSAEPPRALTDDELAAGSESGALLKVLVIDPELFPIAGAYVALESEGLEAFTDDAGVVGFGPLEPGEYSVVVERKGYESATRQVRVGAEGVTELIVQIAPIGRDVPYHETLIFNGHLLCHVVFNLPPPFSGGLNAPCGAVIDLFLPNTSQDAWKFPFAVEHPGFSSLVLEMTWEPQQFGHDGLMQLTTKGTAEVSGSSVGVAGTVYGDTQAAPFHAVLHAGRSYWNSSGEPVIFYPEPNTTENFELLVAGGGGNGTLPVEAALFLEFRPTSYVSLFYNRPATWSFTALPDE